MAGVINYLYDPNQFVWVIKDTKCGNTIVSSVESGTVVQVTTHTNSFSSTIQYDINLTDLAGTLIFDEIDIFSTLTTATTEYEIRKS